MSAHDSTPVNTRIAARPTTYKGVKMRSRLEAGYAEQFDAFGWKWEYEPECFATSEGQYLPDFRLTLNADLVDDDFGPAHTYVEVKPAISWEQECAEVAAIPRWWRIAQACDPAAAAFVLAFGAGPDATLRWMGIIGDWDAPRLIAPAWYGDGGDRVSISSDTGKSSFLLECTGTPTPVASLYATSFNPPIWHEEDLFALRIGGC